MDFIQLEPNLSQMQHSVVVLGGNTMVMEVMIKMVFFFFLTEGSLNLVIEHIVNFNRGLNRTLITLQLINIIFI